MDLIVSMALESKGKIDLANVQTQIDISYILNECCTQLEKFGCDVSYRIREVDI